MLAPVVVGLFWRTLMLSPNFGLVDYLIRMLGFEQVNWLGAPTPALISVIIIHTWQWTPFAFLVLLASLASLPLDVYEAARIDRANAFQRFRYITLPLLRPAIVIVVIIRAMISLSAFAAIFAATGGGPGPITAGIRPGHVRIDPGGIPARLYLLENLGETKLLNLMVGEVLVRTRGRCSAASTNSSARSSAPAASTIGTP